MVQSAGLGVAMAGAFPELKAVASRVIGGHDEEAVADLLTELFLEA
jgi:hydroxymethylpyrimidine pyrophosphatase-like HAD family hydrolase